jgi:Bacterial SH3 domain
MVRHIAACVVAIFLSPALLSAQTAELTVNVASATVYKSPTVTSVAIGTASRGTVLTVTREVGDWVKVAWPEDKDGVGYVRLAVGTLAGHPAPPPPVTVAAMAVPEITTQAQRTVPGVAGRSQYVAQPTHVVGIGGLMTGARLGFGVTARAWSPKRIGVQLEVSRYASTDVVAPDNLTSTRFAPTVLYALPDRLSDYVWLRPYVGAGLSFRNQTLKGIGPNATAIASERESGARLLGGGEVTFSSVPHFALSADAGYEWPKSVFAGADMGGPMFSISAHWYVK